MRDLPGIWQAWHGFLQEFNSRNWTLGRKWLVVRPCSSLMMKWSGHMVWIRPIFFRGGGRHWHLLSYMIPKYRSELRLPTAPASVLASQTCYIELLSSPGAWNFTSWRNILSSSTRSASQMNAARCCRNIRLIVPFPFYISFEHEDHPNRNHD